MAVNKNFVVKNGLEVDTNTLFVDSANNRVAIGTTVPTASLDVRGKILSDSQVESWVGKFVGIVTAGAVGVTTLTYSVGTGSSTKLGRANAEELNVTAGFSTFLSASATDIIVATGSTFSKDLSVGAAATVGAALTVTGQSKFAEFVRFEKDVTVGSALTVTGISTFTGATKFAESSRFEQNVNVGGAATVGGALTVTGNAYFNGNVDIGGDLTFDEVNARNATITGIATLGFTTTSNVFVTGVTTTSKLNVTGVGTVGFLTATNAFVSGVGTVGFLTASNAAVSGMTTTDLLHVGFGATMVKVQGTPATRVGINSIGPAFTLDVDGDINSTGTIRQAGNSLQDVISRDATALAIALG